MQQEKGNISITMLRDQFLLLHMMINDETTTFYSAKGHFLTIWRALTQKTFLEAQGAFHVKCTPKVLKEFVWYAEKMVCLLNL